MTAKEQPQDAEAIESTVADATDATDATAAAKTRPGLGARIRRRSLNWAAEIAKGSLIAMTPVLLGMAFVQMGLATEGQNFEFFSPYEFWVSVSGLVVGWSQWNEWLLLGVGLAALAATLLIYWNARRAHARGEAPQNEGSRKPFYERVRDTVTGAQGVGLFATLATVFLGAYGYQQYLWHVELPVPKEKIGVAFTRQVGGTVARDQLADYLRQTGHEGQIVMRDLPVTFDARDTDRARDMARRIGVDAVVIYRQEQVRVGSGSTPPGDAKGAGPATLSQRGQSQQGSEASERYVAYIVFADPNLGVEIPVPQRSVEGQVEAVGFRAKGGLEVPRLEAESLSRLMEGAAGILLYDKDRYLSAITHLRNAAGDGTAQADPIIRYYLANAYQALDQSSQAAGGYQGVVDSYKGKERLSVQERLVLANAHIELADILFYKREIDQSERHARDAVALRETFIKDENALADAAIFRRVHSTFGAAYLRLIDIATYRQNAEAVTLWSGRAREEAEALRAKTGDSRAQASAIWMLYRTGQCEVAYKLAHEMLARDPRSAEALRLLMRISSARSGSLTNLESLGYLRELLRLEPDNLATLQTQMLAYSLMYSFQDPQYLEEVKETTDRILRVDPYNAEALEGYVSLAQLSTALELTSNPSGLYSIGDVRTYQKLRAGWASDPDRVRGAIQHVESVRPYAVRWVEEVQPQAALPRIYAAKLSANIEMHLYNSLYIHDLKDPELATRYVAAWDRAKSDALRILDEGVVAGPPEKMQGRALLMKLWLHRYWSYRTSDPAGAGEAIGEALRDAEETARLLEANPPTSKGEQTVASSVYIDLMSNAITAKSYYSAQGDTAQAERYSKLFDAWFEQWNTLSQKDLEETKAGAAFLTRSTCASGELREQASRAARNGDPKRASELMAQYRSHYPHDPEGLVALGWYQYLSGEFEKALATTDEAALAAPQSPYGPANKAITQLALGNVDQAQRSVEEMLRRLEGMHLGESLNFLAAHAADLAELARGQAGARQGINSILVPIEKYINGLPSEARTDEGSHMIVALNKFGEAAFWAEDYAAAKRFFLAGLGINADYVLLRTNLALAYLSEGETGGARREYDKALASSATYLKDAGGEELGTVELEAAKEGIKTELLTAVAALEAILKQKPQLETSGRQFVITLQQEAGKYSK